MSSSTDVVVRNKKSEATIATQKSTKSAKTSATEASKSTAEKKEKKEKKARKAAEAPTAGAAVSWKDDECEWDSNGWKQICSPRDGSQSGKSLSSPASTKSRKGGTKRSGPAMTMPQGDVAPPIIPSAMKREGKITPKGISPSFKDDDFKHSVTDAVRSWLEKRRTELTTETVTPKDVCDEFEDLSPGSPQFGVGASLEDRHLEADIEKPDATDAAVEPSAKSRSKDKIHGAFTYLKERTKSLFKHADKPPEPPKESAT